MREFGEKFSLFEIPHTRTPIAFGGDNLRTVRVELNTQGLGICAMLYSRRNLLGGTVDHRDEAAPVGKGDKFAIRTEFGVVDRGVVPPAIEKVRTVMENTCNGRSDRPRLVGTIALCLQRIDEPGQGKKGIALIHESGAIV